MDNNDIDKALQELIELKGKLKQQKQKQSDAAKNLWKNPEWRKKVLESRKYGNLKRWTKEARAEWSEKMQNAKRTKKQNSKPMQADPNLNDLKKKYGFEK